MENELLDRLLKDKDMLIAALIMSSGGKIKITPSVLDELYKADSVFLQQHVDHKSMSVVYETKIT